MLILPKRDRVDFSSHTQHFFEKANKITTPCFFVVCVVNFCSLHATQTAAKKEHNQQPDDRWTIIKTTPKMSINLFGKKVVGHFGRYSDKWHIILSAKKNLTVYSKDVIPNFKNKSLNWNKLCIYAQIYKFGYSFDTLRRKWDLIRLRPGRFL